MAIRLQYFETLSSDLIFQFKWLIGITHRAKGNAAALPEPPKLPGQDLWCVNLDIDKITPGFSMAGESLHEDCITILAFVGTTIIGIDRVIDAGDT